MLKNYLLLAYRTIWKNKLFSLINILGIASCVASCLLIFQYVSFELSYDEFHQYHDRIYRVALDKYQGEHERLSFATNFNGLPKAIREGIPEVEAVTEAHTPTVNYIFTRKKGEILLQFQENHLLYADEHFLNIFSFDLLVGNPLNALLTPYSIVLTESATIRYFGSDVQLDNVMGQTLQVSTVEGDIDYTITGIMKDAPANSHLQFDALLSISTFHAMYPEENFAENWEWYDTYVYIRVQPQVSAAQVDKKLQALLQAKHEAIGEGATVKSQFILQPLSDIHLHSHLQQEASVNGNYEQVIFLVIVALAVVIVAALNYVNLHTAQALKRVKEVGIRKYTGAGKYDIGLQAVIEALLTVLLSLVVTFIMLWWTIPVLNEWLSFSFSYHFSNVYFILLALGALSLLLVLSGSYPAYFMASFEPVQAIKGTYNGKKGLHHFRKGLVGFQFLFSTLAIAFTVMLHQQYKFMQNQPLGFDDQVLVLTAPTVETKRGTEAYGARVRTFKSQLLQSSAIRAVTASTHVPGMPLIYGTSKLYAAGQDADLGVDMNLIGIDADYIQTLGLRILAGKNFSHEFTPDAVPYILNESAARALGFTDFEKAIGQYVVHHGARHQITAIVNDYHQKSLKEPILPLVFANFPYHHEFFSVKITSEDIAETIMYISKTFQESFPDNPFTYYFLDEAFQQQYQAEQRFNLFFHIFSGLIVVIACLGLLSMAIHTAEQKTKEIGIRKVLGASVQSITLLLSGSFLRLIFVASCIAIPIAYLAIQKWLENYAFSIVIRWWMLALPVLGLLLIALLVISVQTIRAALANPVDSLRYE